MVGSVDYNDESIAGQVNVALADRQPGSTLKPFTYLTAFQHGWAPSTMVMDVPTTFGGTYTPLNYDQKFRGPVSVRRALGASLNVPAVKALEFVGLDAMLQTAHRMGINGLRDPARYGLSVTLGGGEVTLLDLTYAYTPFANNGLQAGLPLSPSDRTPSSRQFEPVAILEIRRADGALLYQQQPAEPTPIVDPGPGLPDHRHPGRRRGPRRDVRAEQPAQALAAGGGEDRHHRRLPRLLGHRLHAGPGGRRLGRQQRRQPDARHRRARAGAGTDLAQRSWRRRSRTCRPRPFPRPADVTDQRGLQAVRPAARRRSARSGSRRLFTPANRPDASRTTCTGASRSAR